MIYQLIVDDEFKRLIPPLSSYERKRLEESICIEGCREPLCVWNNVILDGHNRYEICVSLKIPFSFIYVPIKSREEAISWICETQLERRNITEEARKYLIGKKFEVDIDKTASRKSERLAKEYGVHHTTVEKYGAYARAVDVLSKTTPDMPARILSGQVQLSFKRIVELARFSQGNTRQADSNLNQYPIDSTSHPAMHENLLENIGVKKSLTAASTFESVKNMPVYDPDAEILSLALTIPSWSSSISRIHSCTGFRDVSATALRKLEKELTGLRANVYMLLSAIKENN